jgi:hypothetical protein
MKFFWYAVCKFCLYQTKTMLYTPYVNLIPKALLGQFKKNTNAEEERYKRVQEIQIQEFNSVFSTPLFLINKFGYNFFNTLGIKRNNFA